MKNGLDTTCHHRGTGCVERPDHPCWQQTLTAEWAWRVTHPVTFRTASDPEVAAMRVRGYDPDGAQCYYAHRYAIPTPCSDDGEEFYEVVAYAEHVEAWLLLDGGWLVYRLQREDGRGIRHGFQVESQCPR